MCLELSQLVDLDAARRAAELALQLERMYDSIVYPFPYDDIRYIDKTVTSRKIATRRAIKNGFISDLDVYLSDIAGCCSWGKKALAWDAGNRELFTQLMGEEFFKKHPEYVLVRRWITQENTLSLYRTLVYYNEMRVNVLALIHLLDELESR